MYTHDFLFFPANQISEFQVWQRAWRAAHPREIEMRRRLAAGDARGERKRLEAEKLIRADAVQEAARAVAPTGAIAVRDESDIPR